MPPVREAVGVVGVAAGGLLAAAVVSAPSFVICSYIFETSLGWFVLSLPAAPEDFNALPLLSFTSAPLVSLDVSSVAIVVGRRAVRRHLKMAVSTLCPH